MQNIITSSFALWTGLVVCLFLLPVIIHLINRLRHRPVKWAAMSFLLASQKKNKNRVWLRELLLVVARIACLILLLMTIGQVGCQRTGVSMGQGTAVHHYILIDDSLSMNQVMDGKSAMERAKDAIKLIAQHAQGKSEHQITMLRYTQADRFLLESNANPDDFLASLSSGLFLDTYRLSVDGQIDNVVFQAANRIESSMLATNARSAIEVATQMIRQTPDENAIVYMVSDFRAAEWSDNGAHMETLAEIQELQGRVNVQLEMIRCIPDRPLHANVAIVGLEPASSVLVAGVPLMMQVKLKNFGKQTERKIQVQIETATYPPADRVDSVEAANPVLQLLNSLAIEKIDPGETITRQFPVRFDIQGQHALRTFISGDSLAPDDDRWASLNIKSSQRVLLLQSPDSNAAKFVSLALTAGGITGIQVEQRDVSFLRDSPDEALQVFDSVFCLDVEQLEESSRTKLFQFVDEGGGLVFFTGPNCQLRHYTDQLYANGNGLFPLPLSTTTPIAEELTRTLPDITPQPHAVFASMAGTEKSMLDLVEVKRVCSPPANWQATENRTNIIATVRGNDEVPLLVEKKIGKGTVVACLTSADPQWNNWARNPTFPATVLLIQEYVTQGRKVFQHRLTGWKPKFESVPGSVGTKFKLVAPLDAAGSGFDRTSREFTVGRDSEFQSDSSAGELQTLRPGICELWRSDATGNRSLDRFAVNINTQESQLSTAPTSSLRAASPISRVSSWDKFSPSIPASRDSSLSRWLLVLLLVFLVLEQWLGHVASFHPKSRKGNRGINRKTIAREPVTHAI